MQPEPAPRRFVIDSHQHYRSEPGYVDKLVKTYRPLNAMACVLTPMSGFEVVRKAAAEFPDVIIPYGRINVDDPAAAAEIEKFAAAGFKGVKMHSPRYNWDDARYFPLYELITKHEMVALFHTGIASHLSGSAPQYTSMMRMRPGYLDTLTRAFPLLRIQGAHLGNPWYDEAAEAARWAPNLYFDVSGSTLLKKQDDLAFFKKILWWEGPSQHSPASTVYAFEKIVFGTMSRRKTSRGCSRNMKRCSRRARFRRPAGAGFSVRRWRACCDSASAPDSRPTAIAAVIARPEASPKCSASIPMTSRSSSHICC